MRPSDFFRYEDMKFFPFSFALGLFAFAAEVGNPDQPPVPAGSLPERFRVEAATYRGMDGSSATPVALRIDTATGRTWRLTDPSDGKRIRGDLDSNPGIRAGAG